MPSIEIIDILRVVAICAFAGGTSFAGALIARYINFTDRQVLFFTAFGAGILISAAIFGMVIEAEKAFLLKSDALRSPMGGNIAAFKTKQEAEKAKSEFNGEILLWNDIKPKK